MTTPRHQRFHLHTLNDHQREAERLQITIPVANTTAILGQPLAIGRHRLPNRFAVQPMEGFDADSQGAPGPLTFRRYRRYAAGGAALIWFEATAVRNEARSNPGQLYLHKDNLAGFTEVIKAIRETGRQENGFEPVVIIQLTHSGRYSKSTGIPSPIIAHHSPILDPLHKLPPDYPLITDSELDRLQDDYVATARLAAQAGFDGIDIKSCHRYLVSELLASFTREGRYGGSFENRTRFIRTTMARVKDEVPSVFVTTRMSAYDAIPHPYGFGVSSDDVRKPDLSEPLRLVGMLKDIGAPILNISIGNPYYQAHFGRPFDFPIKGVNPPDEHPLEGLARFLSITRTIQEAHPGMPVIGSGYSWLRHLMPNVAAATIASGGAALLGIGRGAFAYPDAPRDVLSRGAMEPAKCCVACSACTQIMRDGAMTGCVVRDSEIYGPQYRLGRRFALDRLQEEARRCRQCEEATCTRNCPATVDIPTFIRAFADGDIRRAYDILRTSNALPEMCGYVCPADEQCQGGCIEKIFCKNPIPIQDIQLLVCRLARREGYAGARIPPHSTGKRIAIVGAGPAGLAAAIHLLEAGHHVTLFDRAPRLGGTPDTLIPGDRYGLAENEVEAILKPAVAAGRLDIRLGQTLGESVRLNTLRTDFDAVLLAVGLTASTGLDEQAPIPGVVDALSFLRKAKKGEVSSIADRVAVLGAGNTAMDAATTARQLGARDVYIVYRRSFAEMPAWPEERERFLAQGGHFLTLTQPVGYVKGLDGALTGVRISRTELGDPDASGRRRPVTVPNSESVLTVALAIEAIGQRLDPALRRELTALTFTSDGRIALPTQGSFATSLPGIYAAGDVVNGGTTAVQGIAEGLKAAREITKQLGTP